MQRLAVLAAVLAVVLAVVLAAVLAAAARPAPATGRDADPIAAARGLVERLLGAAHVDTFEFRVIAPSARGHDRFELDAPTRPDAAVSVRGNTGVALAGGLNWYLKYHCNMSVSWGVDGTGDQLRVPVVWPRVTAPVRMESPVRYRYYMNVCTVSYSMAWWDRERWQREIDWMALNGINLPLAFTGQEYVWERLFLELNMTQAEIDAYLAGPAFLAWNRMGTWRSPDGPCAVRAGGRADRGRIATGRS